MLSHIEGYREIPQTKPLTVSKVIIMSPSKSSTPPGQQLNFTSLPREIRDEIYRLTVVHYIWPPEESDRKVTKGTVDWRALDWISARKRNNCDRTAYSLLFTKASNLQIVEEAREVFYGENYFEMPGEFAQYIFI